VTVWLLMATGALAQVKPAVRVLAIAEAESVHKPFVLAAKEWLSTLGRVQSFSVDYVTTTDSIDRHFLRQYQLFIQLDYPPYRWTDRAKAAFVDYIEQGRGGWMGFHHASLLGEFDGYALWPWFSQFMGGIRYKDYIASFVTATVRVENWQHPVMQGVPDSFAIEREEWYTYDKSPRPNVDVLATVDESTYQPDSPKKMGDHPVIWSNKRVKARNVYFFMGHHPALFQNTAYTTMVRNAIRWAAQTPSN
jgi:type 1 glutamine amidotransferase